MVQGGGSGRLICIVRRAAAVMLLRWPAAGWREACQLLGQAWRACALQLRPGATPHLVLCRVGENKVLCYKVHPAGGGNTHTQQLGAMCGGAAAAVARASAAALLRTRRRLLYCASSPWGRTTSRRRGSTPLCTRWWAGRCDRRQAWAGHGQQRPRHALRRSPLNVWCPWGW